MIEKTKNGNLKHTVFQAYMELDVEENIIFLDKTITIKLQDSLLRNSSCFKCRSKCKDTSLNSGSIYQSLERVTPFFNFSKNSGSWSVIYIGNPLSRPMTLMVPRFRTCNKGMYIFLRWPLAIGAGAIRSYLDRTRDSQLCSDELTLKLYRLETQDNE